MTQTEKLEVLVQKAIDGGWKTPKHGYKIWLPVGSLELLVILYEDYDISVQYNYQAIIFNHDFARALFGEDEYIDSYPIGELPLGGFSSVHRKVPSWIYYLQQAIISHDPINYMYNKIVKLKETPIMAETDLTFGGKAVGLSFNPSNNSEVDDIKKSAANFIDTVCGPDSGKLKDVDGEVIAMRKLALRAAQEAQMWAVKAATWQA